MVDTPALLPETQNGEAPDSPTPHGFLRLGSGGKRVTCLMPLPSTSGDLFAMRSVSTTHCAMALPNSEMVSRTTAKIEDRWMCFTRVSSICEIGYCIPIRDRLPHRLYFGKELCAGDSTWWA